MKLVNDEQLDTALTNTANAIREKIDNQDLIHWDSTNGFADAISMIEVGGGSEGGSGSDSEKITELESIVDGIIDKSIVVLENDRVTTVASYVFRGTTTLTEVSLSNATTIKSYAFYACSNLKYVDLPKVTTLETYSFYNANALETFSAPNLTTISAYILNNTSKKFNYLSIPKLTAVPQNGLRDVQYMNYCDIGNASSIASGGFYGCRALKQLVMRSETMVTLENTSAFTTCYCILGTKNAGHNPNGEILGFFYVPRALISEYLADSLWSTYPNNFRALEDYTVDGTITGEFDFSKV